MQKLYLILAVHCKSAETTKSKLKNIPRAGQSCSLAQEERDYFPLKEAASETMAMQSESRQALVVCVEFLSTTSIRFCLFGGFACKGDTSESRSLQ